MSSLKPLVFALIAVPVMPVLAEPPGTVTGLIPLPRCRYARIPMEKYRGTISGKVDLHPPPPRAGVWIEGPGAAAEAAPPRVSLPQQGYQFTESLIVVPVRTTVEFPNEDDNFHHIQSITRTKTFEIGRYKKGERPTPTETFEKPGLVPLQCAIHDHMKAVILVVNSRWHTVTDSSGKFTLTGVPAGNYTLHAQFDENAKWSASVTIVSGKTVTVDFSKPARSP